MKKFIWNNEEYQYEVVEDLGEYGENICTIIYKGTKFIPSIDLIFWKSKKLIEVPNQVAILHGCNIESPSRNKEETKKILDKWLGIHNRKLEIERGELI